MIQITSKEQVLRLLNATLDGHTQLRIRGPRFMEGIKHVRELVDHGFTDGIPHDDLHEFAVGLICSVQPEEPHLNRYLSELEQGILAAAYFLYTVMHPFRQTSANE